MTAIDAPYRAEPCRKRIWVLHTLTDDDALDPKRALPLGLRCHLAQCPPCRELATRLRAVTAGLGAMGRLNPSLSLATAADANAVRALADGAEPTGRTNVPDDILPFDHVRRPRSRRVVPYGVAAAVLLAVGLYGLAQRPTGRPGVIVDGPADAPARHVSVAPQHRPRRTAPASSGVAVVAGHDAREPQPCIHDDPVDAAMCDRPRALHTASVIRRPHTGFAAHVPDR
ncbi:MAG: hypothetical protein ACE5E6_08575 [Phycisphaerae bacterium]